MWCCGGVLCDKHCVMAHVTLLTSTRKSSTKCADFSCSSILSNISLHYFYQETSLQDIIKACTHLGLAYKAEWVSLEFKLLIPLSNLGNSYHRMNLELQRSFSSITSTIPLHVASESQYSTPLFKATHLSSPVKINSTSRDLFKFTVNLKPLASGSNYMQIVQNSLMYSRCAAKHSR